jgi:catechol 2,3-dioxygenase-like lactoylglutathione lyase family enzyme
MSNISLHHVALRCRNLAAQEAFYTRHFGFKRSATLNRGQPNEFFLLKLGSVRLEFFPPEAASRRWAFVTWPLRFRSWNRCWRP